MMRETRALDVLKRLYPQAHFQTISGMAQGGVFDSNACFQGVEVWVEFKQAKRPKKSGKIRAKAMRGQPAWQALRQRVGGRTFVALMLDSEFLLLPGWCLPELHAGISEERLAELELDEKSLFTVR